MNWNEQVKLLNKSINLITGEINNFEKKTDISNYVLKFSNINSTKNSINYTKINFNNNGYNFDKKIDNIKTSSNLTQNNILTKDKVLTGEKKIKRKHLMTKIHPDKLDNTVNKIKNIIKHKDLKLFECCDFDNESKKISQCVVKILSENLNIMDSLKLLKSNTKLFRYICEDLEMNQEQIDKFEENSDGFSNSNTFSNTIFSDEIINFVNNFNLMTQIKSVNEQVLSYLQCIYTEITTYIKNQIYKKILEKKNIIIELEREKKYLLNDLKFKQDRIGYLYFDNNKNELNNDIIKISEKINEFEERIQMCKEENYIYLVQDEILSQLNVKDFISIYKDINNKSKLVYKYFVELEEKLPIFHKFISKIVGKYYSSFCNFPNSYELDDKLKQITEEEISRVKFSI